MAPWLFLQTKFDSMPSWVRNVTYLTLLFLTVYLFLTPQFVSGQIVARKASGGSVPYRGVDIQTQIDGRLLKFKTDEFGFWSVPVVHKIPRPIKLQVFHQDDRSWFPVKISATDVWTKDFVIVVSNDPNGVSMEVSERRGAASAIFASILEALEPGEASAGVLIVASPPDKEIEGPDDSNVPQVVPTPTGTVLVGEVGTPVAATIAEIAGVEPSAVEREFPIGASSSLSYVDRIQTVEAVESEFGFKIPDEHWQRLTTAGELADYVLNRLILESQFPGLKQAQFPNSWAEIQQAIPANEKPIFVEK